MAAPKLCLVVDSHVKILSCTLSNKNCHLTLMPSTQFWYHFEKFAKFKYYFDLDKLAITLQPSRKEEYVPFPSSLKSIAYFSFFGVRNP